MRFLRSFFVLALACAALAACGSVREDLGLGRSPPDEFAVIDRPPLAMPPDFGLRPPSPGAPRPQAVDPGVHASDALFGAAGKATPDDSKLSAAEKALLQQTGADKASPSIRTVINNESAVSVEADPHLLDKLLWWKNDVKPGITVDAAAEAERIKQARDKGEPLNKSATPIIERDKSGWLGF
jgi:hypothetical protein